MYLNILNEIVAEKLKVHNQSLLKFSHKQNEIVSKKKGGGKNINDYNFE